MDENGRYRCALGIKRDLNANCPSWKQPLKTITKLRFDGFCFRCVEVEYWNSCFEELNYAVWVNLYEMPYEEANYERQPDHLIRFQSCEHLTEEELRVEAMNLYKKMLKPSIDKSLGKA